MVVAPTTLRRPTEQRGYRIAEPWYHILPVQQVSDAERSRGLLRSGAEDIDLPLFRQYDPNKSSAEGEKEAGLHGQGSPTLRGRYHLDREIRGQAKGSRVFR